MNWEHLFEAARLLAGTEAGVSARGRPRQAMLRRSVSTAYYAMFHALCLSNAETLVGAFPTGPVADLWMDTYRTVDHRAAMNRLGQIGQLPQAPDVRTFARLFGGLQEQRIRADYDPQARFARSEVMTLIALAEAATRAFSAASSQARRSLAVYLLVRSRS